MGSDHIEPPFSPFKDMSTDDINYIHSIDNQQVQDLIQNLPDGWIRIDASKLKPGQPPLFFEPFGQTNDQSNEKL